MFNQILFSFLLSLIFYPLTTTIGQENNCQPQAGWEAAYVVQRGDNLFRIAKQYNVTLDQLVEVNCIDDVRLIHTGQRLRVPSAITAENGFVMLTLIDPEDNGQNGVLLGCGDSAVQVATPYPATGDIEADLRTTLETIFEGYNYSSGGLLNSWVDYQVRVDSVSVDEDFALIDLSGDFLRPGHCGDAQLEGQLSHNILMYPEIDFAIVSINGENLRVLFDESGLSDHEAGYSRSMTPDFCPIPLGWQPYQIPRKTNLFRIAIQADSHYSTIASRNCIDDPSQITAGSTIYVPKYD